MKKSQSQHMPKGDILRSIAVLPIFIFAVFMGISQHDYLLAVSSIVVWLLLVLFATNYWLQVIVCLIGSVIALESGALWSTLLLWLLFLYLIHATSFAKRREQDFSNANKMEDSESRTRAVIDLMMGRSPRTSIRIGSTIIFILLSLFIVVTYLIPMVWAFVLNAISKF